MALLVAPIDARGEPQLLLEQLTDWTTVSDAMHSTTLGWSIRAALSPQGVEVDDQTSSSW